MNGSWLLKPDSIKSEYNIKTAQMVGIQMQSIKTTNEFSC